MRVMNLEEVAEFLCADLGMTVTHEWVREQAEPDADGKRHLPVFSLTDGKRAPLYATDEGLRAHFRVLSVQALLGMHDHEILAKVLHAGNRTSSHIEGLQGVQPRKTSARDAHSKARKVL